jgi:Protein of unknown function (DUF2589)
MPTPGQELSSIDFASMLGGPLIAAVNAQAQAAMSAVNFIKEVGFKKLPVPAGQTGQDPTATETGDPIYVKFKYPKELSPYIPAVAAVPAVPAVPAGVDAAGNPTPAVPAVPAVAARPAVQAVFQTQELEVPILTMLPIPYLRIEDVTIDFNAKIDSVEYTKLDESLKVDASLEAKAGWGWGSAKLNVSVGYQRSTQQGTNVQRTYSMAVHIRAVQDEMPAGMVKVLDILESNMRSQPAA